MIRSIVLLVFFYTAIIFASEWSFYSPGNSSLTAECLSSIVIDNKGHKWIGSNQGLFLFTGESWYHFTTDDGLVDDNITSLLISKSSLNLWLSTKHGVNVIDISNIHSIEILKTYQKANSNLVDDATKSLAASDEAVWIGTEKGLSILSGEEWQTLTQFDWLPNNIINAMAVHADSWNYISTNGGGVARIKYNQVDGISSASTLTRSWSGLPSDTVYSAYIDREKVRWFGTAYGVASHFGDESRTNWSLFTEDDGLIDNLVLSIEQDSSEAMWFGTSSGVSRMKNNLWDSWNNTTIYGDSVFDMACDLDGSVWFSTNKGLAHFSEHSTAIMSANYRSINSGIVIYPNPFNSGTTIQFSAIQNNNVKIIIHDIAGRQIREFSENKSHNTDKFVYWDGKNFNKNPVPSGVYIAQVISGENTFYKKLILLK